MKLTKLTLIAASIIFSATSFSQEESQPVNERKTIIKATPEQRAEQHALKMQEKLGLTDEQKTKVYNLHVNTLQRNEKVRQDASLTQEQKKAAIDRAKFGEKAELKGVLTAEQYTKMEEMEAEREAKKETKSADFQKNEAKPAKPVKKAGN